MPLSTRFGCHLASGTTPLRGATGPHLGAQAGGTSVPVGPQMLVRVVLSQRWREGVQGDDGYHWFGAGKPPSQSAACRLPALFPVKTCTHLVLSQARLRICSQARRSSNSSSQLEGRSCHALKDWGASGAASLASTRSAPQTRGCMAAQQCCHGQPLHATLHSNAETHIPRCRPWPAQRLTW